jgi:hypothetical protein
MSAAGARSSPSRIQVGKSQSRSFENAGAPERVPIFHETGHSGAWEVAIGALPLVVPVKPGNIGLAPVHQRGLEHGGGARNADRHVAPLELTGREQSREGGRVTGAERPIEHLARESVDLHDDKATTSRAVGHAQPDPASETVDEGLHPQDELIEHGALQLYRGVC